MLPPIANFGANFVANSSATLTLSAPYVLAGVFAVCAVTETIWPLRARVAQRWRRLRINAGMAACAALVQKACVLPVVITLSARTEEHGWGLLNLPLSAHEPPPWVKALVGVALLDFTLYHWHRLNHRVPFLWRFHNAHHIDRDLDASTALRFHFGELFLSAFYRAFQVVVLGIGPWTLVLFETCVTAAALFHHSNVRLPERWDRVLRAIIVTPRMHGLHHSHYRDETDSNFSTLCSAWDRLHASYTVPDDTAPVTIGVPAYPSDADTSLWSSLSAPFKAQRAWPNHFIERSSRPTHASEGSLHPRDVQHDARGQGADERTPGRDPT